MTSPSIAAESIALLIDADNAPAAKIAFIIAELATYGAVNIRRAFGNWKKPELGEWENVLHEYAIQPVQHFDLVKGKNATDMALVIGAMDILYTKNVGTFGIVSSDCDFTPLVVRLKEEGRQVIGFGGQKTPTPFADSCTRFLYLDDDSRAREVRLKQAVNPQGLKGDTKLMNILRKAVEASEGEDGWSLLGAVGKHIRNQGSFDSRNYGFNKLSDLFSAIDTFEVKTSQHANVIHHSVRDRRRARKAVVRPETPAIPDLRAPTANQPS